MSTRLYVEEFGEGKETLVAVHGLGGSVNSWYPQSQVLNRDLKVVLYDFAGAGRSPVPDEVSIETHLNDLLDLVRNLSGRPVHLAGHSMGTIVCQYFAVRYPELVLSLCMLGAMTAPPDPARAALKARAEKVRSEGMRGIADSIVAAGTSKDTKVNSPAAVAFVRESILGQPADGYAKNCDALAAVAPVVLDRIECSTLLLTGDEDKTAPPDVGRAMESGLRKGHLHILTSCGHWASIERAKQVNYQMSAFYAKLRKRTS